MLEDSDLEVEQLCLRGRAVRRISHLERHRRVEGLLTSLLEERRRQRVRCDDSEAVFRRRVRRNEEAEVRALDLELALLDFSFTPAGVDAAAGSYIFFDGGTPTSL